MTANTRAEQARDLDLAIRRRGVAILGVFAVPWAVTGLLALPVRPLGGAAAAAAISAAVVLITGRVSYPSRGRRLPHDWSRRFNMVGAAQSVIIAATVGGLITVGAPEAIPTAVCFVVGLHFFPLSRVFDQPQYLWTAVALIAVATAGGVALMLRAPEVSRAVVGLGAACSLLLTAISISVPTRRAA